MLWMMAMVLVVLAVVDLDEEIGKLEKAEEAVKRKRTDELIAAAPKIIQRLSSLIEDFQSETAGVFQWRVIGVIDKAIKELGFFGFFEPQLVPDGRGMLSRRDRLHLWFILKDGIRIAQFKNRSVVARLEWIRLNLIQALETPLYEAWQEQEKVRLEEFNMKLIQVRREAEEKQAEEEKAKAASKKGSKAKVTTKKGVRHANA